MDIYKDVNENISIDYVEGEVDKFQRSWNEHSPIFPYCRRYGLKDSKAIYDGVRNYAILLEIAYACIPEEQHDALNLAEVQVAIALFYGSNTLYGKTLRKFLKDGTKGLHHAYALVYYKRLIKDYGFDKEAIAEFKKHFKRESYTFAKVAIINQNKD